MCESCASHGIGRREFLAVSGVPGTAGVLTPGAAGEPGAAAQAVPQRDKQPAKILAAALAVVLVSGGVLGAEPNAPARSFPPPSSKSPGDDLVLWYRTPGDPLPKPNQNLNHPPEALLLGNGRLGAMIFGQTAREVIALNESSLWSGWPEPDDVRPGPYEALTKARTLIRQGDVEGATKAIREEFFSLTGYGKPDFGAYQSFCNLLLTPIPAGAVTEYRRELDLRTAVATVSYVCGGVRFRRETFCSYPDQVWVMRLSADQPGQQSFDLGFDSLHRLVNVETKDHELVLTGQIDVGPEGKQKNKEGMRFAARLVVRTDGGMVSAPQPDALSVRNADAAVLILAGATNYELKSPNYRGQEPAVRNEAVLSAVRDRSYDDLRKRHADDHGRLFHRVELNLGSTGRQDLPLDERLEAYRKSRDDRGLEALFFQYGRYLLIASSRPGGLPANLQGIWNRSNSPPWFCDYHLNINLQMNYWPAEVCNLSECAEPLVRWVEDLVCAWDQDGEGLLPLQRLGVSPCGQRLGTHGARPEPWHPHVRAGKRRVDLPEPVGAFRVQAGPGVFEADGLADPERRGPVLAGQSAGGGKRLAGGQSVLVARARTLERRRLLLDPGGTRPFLQLPGSRSHPGRGAGVGQENRNRSEPTAAAGGRPVRPVAGMA